MGGQWALPVHRWSNSTYQSVGIFGCANAWATRDLHSGTRWVLRQKWELRQLRDQKFSAGLDGSVCQLGEATHKRKAPVNAATATILRERAQNDFSVFIVRNQRGEHSSDPW